MWIAESPINTPVTKQLWGKRVKGDHLHGISLFQSGPIENPEENLLSVLDTVDLHHGAYSVTPPYSEMEIIGCAPTPGIHSAIQGLGFVVVSESADGFIAVRSVQ